MYFFNEKPITIYSQINFFFGQDRSLMIYENPFGNFAHDSLALFMWPPLSLWQGYMCLFKTHYASWSALWQLGGRFILLLAAFCFSWFFRHGANAFFVVLDCAFQRFIVEIVGIKHQLFRHQKLRLIHAHASCYAVIPLYLTKPITAKGAAPRIYTQLSVSIPKYGRRIKYSPIATLQASKEKTNYRSDSPKNILSV